MLWSFFYAQLYEMLIQIVYYSNEIVIRLFHLTVNNN